ncbi:TrkH family potassium uptake protein [Isachenkonia alkalipeptolytica]|uniref:Trk family potassium uptake protein n=1 Tax=Isachenkonia alkalipeptolytica TaxID=2565777 RepID=A0AA44BEW5_9CLOT|nr:TrkH family potassium uptake protein [Isachenkonia alkalipeptolytica]NBG88575.1 Trk family potassium uptake protein [Isachenkonia alkalipeptolytica]
MNLLTSKNVNPTQAIVLGFLSVIIIGSILLNLPIASADGSSVPYVDALFTASSAVAVTGLVVVDTGTHWSMFGQLVILLLIQIGGLGFMTMITMFAMIIGKRISLKERLLIQSSLNQNDLSGVVRLTKYIIIGTLAIEAVGAILLSFVFVPELGWAQGIWFSIFHAVSAFCNAGFDIIGGGVSLMPYVQNPLVNFTVWTLIILGGLGFTVIIDMFFYRDNFRRWSLHTKLVLIISGSLLLTGFFLYLALEWSNAATLGELSVPGKFMAAFFQSVTPRTAGFNTIDTASLTDASKLLTMIFMFIGGSPASTAGGIKTVTFGIVLFTILSQIRGKQDTEVFHRRIPRDNINRALTIMFISLILIITITMILSIIETGNTFLETVFETTSAFGTVGLSLGITPTLSTVGKVLLSVLMFMGRVGPFTVALALAKSTHKNQGKIRYPEDKVIIG